MARSRELTMISSSSVKISGMQLLLSAGTRPFVSKNWRDILMPNTNTAQRVPTSIDIRSSVDIDFSDEESPYYERTALTLHISSTSHFDRVTYTHLGFHARSDGKRRIRHKSDRYTYIGDLDPNVDAQAVIDPFRLCFENLGDSFMGVHVRMKDGMKRYKITILQEHT